MLRSLALTTVVAGLTLSAGAASASTDTTSPTATTSSGAGKSSGTTDDSSAGSTSSSLPSDPAVQAAIDAFEQRLVEAGFVDTGRPASSDSQGDSDPTATTPETTNPFEECNAAFFEGETDTLPGAEASTESNAFVFEDRSSTDTTEMFDMTQPQQMSAVVATIDPASRQQVDDIIAGLTDPATLECLNQAMQDQLESQMGSGDELPPDAIKIEMSTPGAPGVGETSGEIDFAMEVNFMFVIKVDARILIARQGDYVAMISQTNSGGATSDLDAVEQLGLLVADLP